MITAPFIPFIFAATPQDDPSGYDTRQFLDGSGQVQGYYIETPCEITVQDAAGKPIGTIIKNPNGDDVFMSPAGAIEGYLDGN